MEDTSDHNNNNERESKKRIARGEEASEETREKAGVPNRAEPVADDDVADIVEALHREPIDKEIKKLREQVDYQSTVGSARKWWDAFEEENANRKEIVLKLLQELANRKATIREFFLTYVYSNTDNIQGNLYYLDYSRLKKKRCEEAPDDGSPSDDATSIDEEIEELREQANYQGAGREARTWWDALEKENVNRKAEIRKLLRELAIRKATINEFFVAWLFSDTNNYQAVLHYLDYIRLKNQ